MKRRTTARYRLLAQGPDNSSTYPECWGNQATSDGRLLRSAKKLALLAKTAKLLTHDNWCIQDTQTGIWISSRGFWRHPEVRCLNKEALSQKTSKGV